MTKLMDKALAIFLAIMLCVCFLPALAIADDEGGTFAGVDYAIADDVLTLKPAETPAEGAVSGTLDVGSDSPVPWAQQGICDTFSSLKVESGITAGASLEGLFENCSNLADADEVANINTAATTNMSNMFKGCTSLATLNVQGSGDGGGLDTRNVTTCTGMFPASLESITIGPNFTLLQDLGWNVVYNVTKDENGNIVQTELTEQQLSDSKDNPVPGEYRNYAVVESISLPSSPIVKTVNDGPFTIDPTLTPDKNLKDGNITWSVSGADSAIAIGETTGVVTIKGVGTNTVTATVGEVSGSCTVTVNPLSLSTPEGNLPQVSLSADTPEAASKLAGLSLTVKSAEASSSETIQSIVEQAAGSGSQYIEAYDISLLNGNSESVPYDDQDNPITVSINVSNDVISLANAGTLAIYYVDVDGSTTQRMNITATTDAIEFKTTHLSTYALVSVPKTAQGTVTSVELERSSYQIFGNGTETIKAFLYPKGVQATIAWTSSNTDVATVDESGVVTAKGPGTTEITASAGEKSASCNVTVYNVAESISLAMNQVLTAGDQTKVTATVVTAFDGEFAPFKCNWTQKPENFVSLAFAEDDTAQTSPTITASTLGNGALYVTAMTQISLPSGGSKLLQVGPEHIDFEVKAPSVDSISFDEEEMTLTGQQSQTLTPTVQPDGFDLEWLTWSYDNEVVSCEIGDGSVSVTAQKKGQTTITASGLDADGKTISASCVVTVSNPVTTITVADMPKSMNLDDTVEVNATLSGALPGEFDAVDSIEWKSSDDSVVSVAADEEDQANATLQAASAGTANITVTVTVGDATITASYAVEVLPFSIDSIEIEPSSLEINVIDDGQTLEATTVPEVDPSLIKWQSDNTDVITVDDNGFAVPVAAGGAIITATVGEKTAQCYVSVKSYVLGTAEDSQHNGHLSIGERELAEYIIGLDVKLLIQDDVSDPADEIEAAIGKVAEGDFELIEAYDITLVDQNGDEVPFSSNQWVSVSMDPSPALKDVPDDSEVEDSRVSIYYISDDLKTAELMPSWYLKSELSFSTPHLSTYALTVSPDAASLVDDGNRNDDVSGLAKTGEQILAAVTAPTTLNALGLALAMLITAMRRFCRKGA